MLGAEMLVRSLEAEGVSIVFGYPGAAILPVYDALSRSSIRHVLVRHEQNAGHAASGYARAAGKAGVCMATSGPGATNLITALATAYMDSIPIVAITGQVGSELLGRDVFQEADITGATASFVKHSYLVKKADELPQTLRDAFHIATTGRPGPVLLDLPVDVQQAEAAYQPAGPPRLRGYKPTTKGHPMQVARLAEALAASKRPVLCAGGGVIAAHAVHPFRALADRCGIPVVHTMMGKGVMPYDHPLYLGMVGTHGAPAANRAIEASDLLILVGARVGDRAVMTPNVLAQKTRIAHIDIDPAEIGKNMSTSIPIVGDAKNVLNQLLDKAAPPDTADWLRQCASFRTPEAPFADTALVNPRRLIARLSAAMNDNAVYVADVGRNQIWSAKEYNVRRGKFLTSCGMGTMGYALPAAIGAQLARPGTQVVAVCGDGSFQMALPELATVAQEGLDVKLVVLRDRRLGMIAELQDAQYGGNRFAVELGGLPALEPIAAAYGLGYGRAERDGQVDGAVQRMLRSRGGYLLEALVEGENPPVSE